MNQLGHFYFELYVSGYPENALEGQMLQPIVRLVGMKCLWAKGYAFQCKRVWAVLGFGMVKRL